MALSTREVFLILRARDEASRVLRGFSNNLNKIDKDTMKTAQAQVQRGQAMSSIGVGLAAAGIAAASFFKTAVDSSLEYTRQAALTKTQTDKVVVSIEQLKDIGREVGASVPTDFDHIQQSLYDIFSSMEVNLPQAKKLLKEFAMESVAGQENLTEAGKGTIGIMNAFKIPIEKVRTVSDTMFQLVRKGVGTYVQFNRTIGRAVPSAVRAGQSFEDLAGMMAFLTRNGLSAAMASASAGRALDAFSNPKVVGRLEDMGIAVRNAKGEFLPIADVVTALGKKLAGLTAPERADALQELFKGAGGTIQARRFYDIAVKNYDQLNLFTNYMKNSKGSMQQAYDIMFKQPQSQAQLLTNNMKILKTVVGDALLPAWVKLTGSIIKVVKWFNNLSPHTRNLIVKLSALAAVLAVVIGGVLAVAGVFLMFTAGLAMAGTTLGAVLVPIALVIAAIIAIGVAIFFIIKYHKQIWAFMKKVWSGAVQLVKRAWQELQVFGVHVAAIAKIVGGALVVAWHAVVDAVIWFGKMMGSVFTAVGKAIWGKIGAPIKEIAGWFVALGGWFAKLGKDIWEGLGPPLTKVWAALQEGAMRAWAAIYPALKSFVKTMGEVWQAIKGYADSFVNVLNIVGDYIWKILKIAGERFANFGRMLGQIFKWIWENGLLPLLKDIGPALEWLGRRFMDFLKVVKYVMELTGAVIRTAIIIGIGAFKLIAAVVTAVIPPVLELVGKIIGRLIAVFKGLIEFVVGVFTGNWRLAWEGVKDIIGAIFGTIKDVLVGAVKIIIAIFKGFAKGIVDAAKWLWDKLVGHSIFPDIVEGIIYWFRYLLNMGPKVFKLLIDGIVVLSTLLLRHVISVAKDIVAPFVNAGKWLYQYGKNFVQGLINGIKTWAPVRWMFDNVINPAVGAFTKAGTWLLQAGKNVIAGFRDGMVAIWKDVTTWVAGIATWIKDHKGPVSLDGKLLVPAGKAIMSGFLSGLKTGAGPAWDFVTKVGGRSVSALWSALGVPKQAAEYLLGKGSQNLGGRRVRYSDEQLDLSTFQKIRQAENIIGALLNITQGSYSTRVAASGSTHAGGGVFDVVGGDLRRIERTLRSLGFAAWLRDPSQGPWGYHVHAVEIGNPNLSASAAGQVKDYLRGGDGLAGYAKGAWKIMRNQMAYLHKGEMVVPEKPAESMRRDYSRSSDSGGSHRTVNMPITINTQEIDPRKHAADLGWEYSRRVG